MQLWLYTTAAGVRTIGGQTTGPGDSRCMGIINASTKVQDSPIIKSFAQDASNDRYIGTMSAPCAVVL